MDKHIEALVHMGESLQDSNLLQFSVSERPSYVTVRDRKLD